MVLYFHVLLEILTIMITRLEMVKQRRHSPQGSAPPDDFIQLDLKLPL